MGRKIHHIPFDFRHIRFCYEYNNDFITRLKFATTLKDFRCQPYTTSPFELSIHYSDDAILCYFDYSENYLFKITSDIRQELLALNKAKGIVQFQRYYKPRNIQVNL